MVYFTNENAERVRFQGHSALVMEFQPLGLWVEISSENLFQSSQKFLPGSY